MDPSGIMARRGLGGVPLCRKMLWFLTWGPSFFRLTNFLAGDAGDVASWEALRLAYKLHVALLVMPGCQLHRFNLGCRK